MKFIVTLAAFLFLGIGAASADHHGEQSSGPEHGQGLKGQGAESSGGKSTEAIQKDKDSDSDTDSDSGQDSDSDEGAE
jgi:hypothetical protein